LYHILTENASFSERFSGQEIKKDLRKFLTTPNEENSKSDTCWEIYANTLLHEQYALSIFLWDEFYQKTQPRQALQG
jgi:hypothetical protein